MKRIFILSMILLIGAGAQAQKSKVRTAYFAYENNDLEKAIENIEIGIQDEKAAADEKSWYYRGLIYEKAYKLKLDSVVNLDTALNRAYDSYVKTIRFDEKDRYTGKIVVPGLGTGMNFLRIALINTGDEARQNQEYQQAYDYYKKALHVNEIMRGELGEEMVPVDTAVIFYKGYTVQLMGRTDEVVKIYDDLINMGYSLPIFYTIYAQWLSAREDYERAMEVVLKGQELNPTDIDLLTEELNIYLRTDRTAEAVTRFEQAVELAPGNPELHFALGTIYDKLAQAAFDDGATEEAEEFEEDMLKAYQRTIELDSSHMRATYNIGVFYFNEAVEIAKEMSELPLSANKEYKKMEKERNKQFEEALPFLEKAHQLESQDESTLIALKEAYLRLDMIEKFEEMSQKLKEIQGPE